MLEVVFFQRKPRSHGNFSIEILFQTIREYLPVEIKNRVSISKYESTGLWKRIYNVVEASLKQGSINHVTGDVHFLTYLLNRHKTVLTIHDCGFMHHPSALARLILKTFWLTLPINRSAVITVVSEATKQEVLKYVNCTPDKIRVVPNFVLPVYTPHPKKINTVKPRLLQIGTAPNKNLNRLIEAIEDIPCHLEIVGKLTPELQSKLQVYRIEYSHSCNLSEEEMIDKYQQCDILTFVSTYEGFGMPIIEANAIGRPVVTSNILSMPEVAGNAACLVDPFNSCSIREGIMRVIQYGAYRSQLIKNGFDNVKRYQIDRVAKMYQAIYYELNAAQ